MDAYAFALTLGTAGLAAMTVLGFHHERAADHPVRGGAGTGAAEAATQSMMTSFKRCWRCSSASAPPTKLPARDEQQAIERLVYVFDQRHSWEPGGAA